METRRTDSSPVPTLTIRLTDPAVWWGVLMLTLLFQAIVPSLARDTGTQWFRMSFASIEVLLQIGAIMITALLLLLARREVLHWLRSLPRPGLLTIGVFLAWALLSVAWSQAPGRTLFQFGGMAGATMVALWLVWRFGAQGLLELLAVWGLLIAVASYMVIVFAPQVGMMGAGETGIATADIDRWRGVFHHKNLLGTFGALAAAVWVVFTARFRGIRMVPGLVVILALSYLMARAEAVAPLAGLGAFLAAFAVLSFWRGLPLARILPLAAALVMGFSAALYLPQWPTIPLEEKRAAVASSLAQATERRAAVRDRGDSTAGISRDIQTLQNRLRAIDRQLATTRPDATTGEPGQAERRNGQQAPPETQRDPVRAYSRNPEGRTRIWDAALAEAWNRPVLGHGLGGFWRGRDGPSAALQDSMPRGWIPRFGHAFWVDVILDLGLVGALLLFVMLAWPSWTGLRRLHAARRQPLDAQGILVAGLLALLALVLVRYSAGGYLFHSGPWVLVVLLVLTLHRLSAERTQNTLEREPERTPEHTGRRTAG